MLRFYTSMRIKDKDNSTFTSGGFYNMTVKVQENTLLNRGVIDTGGAVAQTMMSNNHDEMIERGVMCGLYLFPTLVAPYILLPFFSKTFLKRNNIVKEFANNEWKIIEVSKKYLTKDAKYMVEGFRETALKLEEEATKAGKKLHLKQDFENVLKRYPDKEVLKNKLIKTHDNILFTDFLSTALMWCATPWLAMEVTKKRTNRSGYSGTYEMIDEKQSSKNAQKYEQEKKKKIITSLAFSTISPYIFSRLVTKGITDKTGTISNFVKRFPECFNYTRGVYPSKTIFAAIWLMADFPTKLVSARDKYERRDRFIRDAANIAVFFGGDFVLNNALGRLSDHYLETKIMDRSKLKPNAGFFRKLALAPRSFAELKDATNLPEKILKRTKNIGAAMYWATLIANTFIIGFGVPIFLNMLLKKTVKEDLAKQNNSNQVT